MMHSPDIRGAAPAVLHDGSALTLDDLPPRYNRRWPPELQARLLAALAGGLLSDAEACMRYMLQPADLQRWRGERDDAARPADCAAAPAGDDRVLRLVTVLVQRGYLSDLDAAYIADPNASRFGIEAFLVDDAPLF